MHVSIDSTTIGDTIINNHQLDCSNVITSNNRIEEMKTIETTPCDNNIDDDEKSHKLRQIFDRVHIVVKHDYHHRQSPHDTTGDARRFTYSIGVNPRRAVAHLQQHRIVTNTDQRWNKPEVVSIYDDL